MMKIRLMSTTLLLGWLLSACSQPNTNNTQVDAVDAQSSVTNTTPVSTDMATQTQASTVLYACTPSKQIAAVYDNSDATQPKAVLTIDGVAYEMYSVIAASGARYATEQGMQPEQGMQWHSKADKAVLMTMTLDHTAKPEDEKILFDCTEQVTS